MTARIKFCGLTRPEDAAHGAALGASYLGVIFAPSPRRLAPEVAARVLERGGQARRVGVFGAADPAEVAAAAREARLDVAQLHGDPGPAELDAVRRLFGGAVWAVARVRDGRLPDHLVTLAAAADAIVLDAWSGARLGGTGERFDWEPVARQVDTWRGRFPASLVLAGGLAPENVGEAIALFAPDVVDVSSGVERAPGIKDHERMRAFADAVGAARAHDAETR